MIIPAPRDHARRIFHFAKGQHLNGEEFQGDPGNDGGPWQQRQGHQGNRNRARGAIQSRGEALSTLGLKEGVTAEAIKSRHRELVRKFHPDRHQHLGEVAAKEAEERFRQVQSAYEFLSQG